MSSIHARCPSATVVGLTSSVREGPRDDRRVPPGTGGWHHGRWTGLDDHTWDHWQAIGRLRNGDVDRLRGTQGQRQLETSLLDPVVAQA